MKEKIGAVKKNVGKLTGDEKTRREGQADEIRGKVQNIVGGVKDSLREDKNGHH